VDVDDLTGININLNEADKKTSVNATISTGKTHTEPIGGSLENKLRN